MSMNIASFRLMEFWSRTLYQKREVNALFIADFPKNQDFYKILTIKNG